MTPFWKLSCIKIKLFIREPAAIFFTLCFAPMMLVIFGEIYGNNPVPIFDNHGTVDIALPSYIAIIIASVGLMGLPVATAASRERGELRRLRLTPLNPTLYMFVDILVYLLMVVFGVIILTLIGVMRYHAHIDGNLLSISLGLVFCTVSFFSFGFMIAAVSSTSRIAQAIGMFLCLPMLFLSGSGMPLELMPKHLKTISDFMPLKYVVTLMRGLWAGDPFTIHYREIIILGMLLCVCAIISAVIFRWE